MLHHKGEHVIETNMYSSLRAVGHIEGVRIEKNEVIHILCEGILARREWSRFEEMSRRERNSQADTLPRSKINTRSESSLMREDETCNVHSLVIGKFSSEDPLRCISRLTKSFSD